MKKNLFVTQKAKISRENYQLKLVTEDSQRKIPISLIKNLYLFGKAELNHSAKTFLLEKNIDIYFLTYSGKLKGILTNTILKSHYRNRLLQYKAFEDKSKNIKIAKWIVGVKIEKIESYYGRSLKRYAEKLKEADNPASILGIEGTASRFLFEKVKRDLKEIGVEFEGRNYYPPKDFVNALLSFVYSVYYSYVYSLTLSYGLDPYIGFLHIKRGTHAPLISDIMEFKRVDLSSFAVDLLRDGIINSDDFDESFRLKSDKIRVLINKMVERFYENEEEEREIDGYINKMIGYF